MHASNKPALSNHFNFRKMGKNKGGIPQKEQFQRMQYLYQVHVTIAITLFLKLYHF